MCGGPGRGRSSANLSVLDAFRWRAPVITDHTRMCELPVGRPAVRVLGVVDLLEVAGLVELTRDTHGEVTGLTSEVPYFQDLYVTLGVAWRRRRPSQFEEELVAVVDQLAAGPFRAEMLVERVGIEATEVNLSRLHGRGATWTGGVEFVSRLVRWSPGWPGRWPCPPRSRSGLPGRRSRGVGR